MLEITLAFSVLASRDEVTIASFGSDISVPKTAPNISVIHSLNSLCKFGRKEPGKGYLNGEP